MTKEEVYQAIRAYLQKQHPDKEVETLTETDNLFESGYLTSLTSFELIEFLEDLQGRELPIENYAPSAFYTLQSIFEAFFAETANE